jgi:cytochrome c oxidase assembly protein Cox11
MLKKTYLTVTHYAFYFTTFIINVLFFSVISISLYRLLCRFDLAIFEAVKASSFYMYSSELFFFTPVNIGMRLITDKYYLSFSTSNTYSYFASHSVINGFCSSYLTFSSFIQYSEHYVFFELKESFYSYSKILEVQFFTKVQSFTHIDFLCLQDNVYLISNDTTLVFFRIRTYSEDDISCIIIFLISPSSYMSALTKLQCFCFDNLLLSSNESTDLPVIFNIDFNMLVFFSKKINLLFFYLLLEK